MAKVLVDDYPKGSFKHQKTDGVYMDGYLQANLDHVKHQVTKKDYDGFIIITGREGFGKSTLAIQIGNYLDPNFSINNVVFTAQQFQEATESAKRFSCIVFDETMGYLGSRGATSKFNRMLIKIMSEMRSKNLFIILCIPNFFELDKYPAIHRSTGLIHVRKRAHFGSYDYRKKKDLYLKGKKFYEYNVSPNFTGVFGKHFPIDKVAYEHKKQDAINHYQKTEIKDKVYKNQRNLMINLVLRENYMSREELSNLLGISQQYLGQIAKEIEDGVKDE